MCNKSKHYIMGGNLDLSIRALLTTFTFSQWCSFRWNVSPITLRLHGILLVSTVLAQVSLWVKRNSCIKMFYMITKNSIKQAGAELCQAQLKLGFDCS